MTLDVEDNADPFLNDLTAGQMPSVLVVDDDPESVLLLGKYLSEEYDVSFCLSGDAALKHVEKHKPDLILMDVSMPGMDGLEACRLLKSNPESEPIPVVFITSSNTAEDESACFEAGANDFVAKPVNRLTLQTRVRTQIMLKLKLDDLRRISDTDTLTGLYNRRYFMRQFEQEWNFARRHVGTIGLLMADIDHFKSYNDTYGHLAGDDCLRAVAAAMKQILGRSSDIVSRFGGEEFLMLASGTAPDALAKLAETLRQRIERLYGSEQGAALRRTVTVSIGGYCFVPTGKLDAVQEIGIVDQALYRAKSTGRNKCCFYTPETAS